MPGIIGAIILVICVLFIEIRSRRNGHAAQREEFKNQIDRMRDQQRWATERQKDAQAISLVAQNRLKF